MATQETSTRPLSATLRDMVALLRVPGPMSEAQRMNIADNLDHGLTILDETLGQVARTVEMMVPVLPRT